MTALERWALRLRDAYGEQSLDAASLLARIDRVIRRAASSADRTDVLRATLNDVFGEQSVEGAALRLHFLEAVEVGDMRPSGAGRWAELFGWARFMGWADPSKFDPMTEEYWTLPMTAAWIRWRDDPRERENKARRCWPEYIAASTRWEELELEHAPDDDAASRSLDVTYGYVIAQREDRGWSDLPGELTETKHVLRETLKSGKLLAERYNNGKFVPIPRSEWGALNIIGFYDDDGVHKVIAPDGSEYLSVRVPSKQVHKVFNEPAAGNEKLDLKTITTAKAKELLLKEEKYRGGGILSKQKAELYLRNEHGYRGRTNIRDAVDELTGGRSSGRPVSER